jgi:hypothetical protein
MGAAYQWRKGYHAMMDYPDVIAYAVPAFVGLVILEMIFVRKIRLQ